MASYGYGRPALRSSVDVQLQSAFSDGNWNAVIRLAAKRAATLKDPYYEVRVPRLGTVKRAAELTPLPGHQDLRRVSAGQHRRKVRRAGRR